jgi:hypothetical protein
VTQEVQRNYLEIKSIQDLNEVVEPNGDYSLKLLESTNFQLNKFFYKNIGKKHKWIDRLVWKDAQAIQKSFNESLNKSINRVWVHTCSLDHKNALSNYIARGMKIFKTETIKI